MNKKNLFVLDIGTRFVRGLILEEDDSSSQKKLVIKDGEVLEHKERAMFAGQIHDIEKVAKVVKQIKKALEERNNIQLNKVCCAVAGRNLYTQEGEGILQRPNPLEPITEKDIINLEFLAVENALQKVFKNIVPEEFYCVGYAVSEYFLDGEKIKNLLYHTGKELKAKVLVTLLHRKVLESLFSVVEKCGLEIGYLTLEPIAALEATLPKDIYNLNLVLVDVGAGTSDISCIFLGKILSFGMVPHAGDDITEGLSKELLVDFNQAEYLKRLVGSKLFSMDENISYTDIFGRLHQKSVSEIFSLMLPYVDNLAKFIADEIKKICFVDKLDGVVLVGGGSLTPMLEKELAKHLGIEDAKVGIYGNRIAEEIEDLSGRFTTVNFATSLGIALLAYKRPGFSLMHITINGKNKTLLKADDEEFNVLKVLLSCGFTYREIYGKIGLAKTFYLNGELKTIKGNLPKISQVKINGMPVSLDTLVKEGDNIEFYPAVDGEDAKVKVKDILELKEKKIKFNGEIIDIPMKVLIDSKVASLEDEIPDRANVTVCYPEILKEFFEYIGVDILSLGQKTIRITVNGEPVTLEPKVNYELYINGKKCEIKEVLNLYLGDIEEISFKKFEPKWYIKEFVKEPLKGKDLKVKINNEEYIFNGQEGKIFKNGEVASLETEVMDGDEIIIKKGKDAECILADVFRYININPEEASGKRLRLLINGKDAGFSTPLFDNAEIEVGFIE